ncbi:hypothetical protein FRB99_003374 [Tulasnella sp. 403]|nr:hypothetical protein FRB99_003374 [Tulasnella sp. 403]
MPDPTKLEQESAAFIAWITTFPLSRPVESISDLSDGSALFDILATVDAQYFRPPTRPSSQPSENWVLRFGSLKRLYRLITQYYADVLHQPVTALEVPDLQAVAKDYNVPETLRLCRLIIAMAVQSEKNKDVIERIQGLKEIYQSSLMRAIEKVMSKLTPTTSSGGSQQTMTDDDHYYEIQSERSRILTEKATLEKVYQTLMEEHRTLQSSFDDLAAEKNEAESQLREVRQQMDDKESARTDAYLRAEIDRLRSELQKSEDNLGHAENELDQQTTLVADLRRKVEELQTKASETDKLKDKLDEYRHAADKLQKTENVMEKYKKKLEESAELRRTVKSLEEQNASLVDKNASLEEEYRKVAAFKPLMESYKNQIADLEGKNATKQKDMDSLKFELDQIKVRLRISMDERAKDAEALELYQERVRELELASSRSVNKPPANVAIARTTSEAVQNIIDGEPSTPVVDQTREGDDEDDGLGGELDDALTGRTMTDLKLQVRQLKRDLEAAKTNQAEASRVLVLENLLEDANRMKSRYEADYLASHREKLVLQSELDGIRSGKSLGDGPEAAIALRQRLNETVEELDTLKKQTSELAVQNEHLERGLTIAKSDLNLVNKDQLDILASLRESVNEEKAGLEVDIDRLNKQILDLKDKNKMQLEQINTLLLEKVSLQTESIGQREKMLLREQALGDLRNVISGKDLPEETKAKLLELHEENVQLKEQLKTTQEKLLKARQFIKSQDKLFQEEYKSKGPDGASSSEAEAFRLQVKQLQSDGKLREYQERYRREQQLMLSAVHELGMKVAREHLSNQKQQRSGASSWLAQQRQQMGPTLKIKLTVGSLVYVDLAIAAGQAVPVLES